MHNRRNINSHTVNEGPISFSRAVVSDGLIFVSATSGHNYAAGTLSPSIEEQADQALSNISAALAGAGAYMKDVVRVRYLIPERTEFEKTFPILQKWFGDAKPAATVMICGLYEEGVKIEIEVTARRSSW